MPPGHSMKFSIKCEKGGENKNKNFQYAIFPWKFHCNIDGFGYKSRKNYSTSKCYVYTLWEWTKFITKLITNSIKFDVNAINASINARFIVFI